MASNPVDRYARAVVAGRVPAGKYHRLACARHLRDRQHEGRRGFPYRFNSKLARRFVTFAERLRHYKGQWAGQLIRLEPQQHFRLGSIIGWVHAETGYRRFRHSYTELPRKNGKSIESSIVAIYLTFFDREPGAEGYTAATKRDQAKIVFNDAKMLVISSGLRKRIAVLTNNLSRDTLAQKLEPLGADYDTTDGLNPHFISLDEVHALKDRGMIDVLETATGSRRQPMIFKITTAGDSLVSPCGAEHEYACKILERTLTDERYFAFIAHADEGDDWTDERTWRKANPNYGVSVLPDDLRAAATKAKGIPAAAAAFKQKRLNLWVSASAPCLSVDGWKRGQSDWTEDGMRGERCYVGIDLASKIDLCACAFVFPPTETRKTWRLVQRIWTPEETVAERAMRDRAPYQEWIDAGWLRTMPGPRMDAKIVRQAIIAERERFAIQAIGFDPWHAPDLINDLAMEDGFDPEQLPEVKQTFAGMSAACLHYQAATLAAEIDARGCPVTAWAVGNVVGNTDGKGNLMFHKGKSHARGRIDPVIASTIGMAVALREAEAPQSAYADHGLMVL